MHVKQLKDRAGFRQNFQTATKFPNRLKMSVCTRLKLKDNWKC